VGFLVHRLRTWLWTAFYRAFGRLAFERVGPGCRFEGWVDIPQAGGRIRIGAGARIGRHVELTVLRGAELEIGERAFIGRGVVLSAHRRVVIGPGTLIAEYVSIHDNDHRTRDRGMAPARGGFAAEPVEIGAHCWVGAHATLVKGAALGAGCTIGAGSVVTGRIAEGALAAGAPAREIRRGSQATPVEGKI
jgi:acetyltransferase-like isoleucine patch superfamily enzyme